VEREAGAMDAAMQCTIRVLYTHDAIAECRPSECNPVAGAAGTGSEMGDVMLRVMVSWRGIFGFLHNSYDVGGIDD
jgi:hypothetical protein